MSTENRVHEILYSTDSREELAQRIAALEAIAHDIIEHVEEPPCESCMFEGTCLGRVTQCDEWSLLVADAQRLGIT